MGMGYCCKLMQNCGISILILRLGPLPLLNDGQILLRVLSQSPGKVGEGTGKVGEGWGRLGKAREG